MNSINKDRTVGALPVTGTNEQKARFFREVASAFEFLSMYYSLSAEDQQELMSIIQQYSVLTKEKKL